MKLFGLFLLLCLPAIAALGFDLWLAYGENMDFSKPLELSAVGWLWVKYAEDNYNMIRDSIDPATWASFIKPVLSQKLVTVALLPVYIAVPVMLVMKTFGLGSHEGNGWLSNLGIKRHKQKGYAYDADLGDSPRKKMKYNRR
jgi:hypothetical protein